MASNKKSEETIVDISQAYSKSESFLNENGSKLTTVFAVVVLALLAFFAYKKFVVEPKAGEAAGEIWKAEYYYENQEFDKALNGTDMYPGFEEIAETYSGTPSGNLANHYAGIIYLEKGEYATAIDYLSKASFDDLMLEAARLGAIGDASVQLGDLATAASSYSKAVAHSDNELTAPIYLKKLALVHEENGDTGKALTAYKRLKSEYSATAPAKDVDKYIGRLSVAN